MERKTYLSKRKEILTMTDTELHALGFTRQSKTMWRKGDVTYQNGKFYRNGIEISYDPQRAEEGKKK